MGAVELHSSLLQSAINANILICDFIQIARSPCLEEGGGGGDVILSWFFEVRIVLL